MAKQLVNPFERHVEKAVLGIAGLALIYVVALYVVTTPNYLELGGERVTPSTIDEKVAQKATDAALLLKGAPRKPIKVDPLHDTFVAATKPLEIGPLPGTVALGPEVPIIERGIFGAGARLAKVQTPAKPAVSHGRSTFIVPVGADQTRYQPSYWVSVSAMFDVKSHLDAQKRDCGPPGESMIFGPPQIQRRKQRSDGSWSDGDWQDVEARPAAKIPREPTILLSEEGGKLFVDKDVLKHVDAFRNDIATPSAQLDIIRPMPPQMAPPTHWTLPVITTYKDVLKMDDEHMFPNEPPAQEPMDRYGLSGEKAAAKAPPKERTPEQQRAQDMDDAVKLIQQARQTKSKNDATKAYNLARGVIDDRTANATEKARAERIKAEAEQAERDIIREERMPGAAPSQPGREAGPEVKPKREKLPSQQIWAHDAAVGSLEDGATYQYRLRFRVYNVLAGAPNKFNNPEDSTIVFLESEWSPPSDPIFVEPDAMFFVTSEIPKDQEISVEFYKWYMGVWLKPEGRIKAGIGQKLYLKKRTPAPDLIDPTKVDNPEIEFTADATVVDIDFDRPFREAKRGSSGNKGVRFAQPTPSTAVVFMDSQGRLFERFVPSEKTHPDKREIEGRKWVPPKQSKP